MYSKVKIAGHPVHPMLIAFPVAFYTAALASFIAYSANANPFWFRVGIVANAAGVIMALVAAVPGFIDWLNIPAATAPKRTGMIHLSANVIALVLFAINYFVQRGKWDVARPVLGPALLLTGLGFLITLVAGFYGWTLVQDHHVGVNPLQEGAAEREARGEGTVHEVGERARSSWQAASHDRNDDADKVL